MLFVVVAYVGDNTFSIYVKRVMDGTIYVKLEYNNHV